MNARTVTKTGIKQSAGDAVGVGGGNRNLPNPKGYPFQRMLFPVHVYVHFTDTPNYVDRVMQIKRRLIEERFFPFPITFTPVLATGVDTEIGLFDVYVVGGQRRYRLGIVNDEYRIPSLVEVLDTVGWASLLHAEPDSKAKDPQTASIVSQQHSSTEVLEISLGDLSLGAQDLTYVCQQDV